jgi:ABC-type polysaccharide/polyol phosphate transport system ATPase subunit
MNDEVLVKVENVSKKFCRSLKRSLRYGLQDMLSELNPFSHRSNGTLYSCDSASDRLRPDEFWAVKGVSFELRRGECLGLIGRNGAGKTTLLKMLNGLIKPDQGCITMRGRVGALIALGAGFNPILTGRENIYINGSILGLSKKEIDAKIDDIIEFAEISDFIDTPVQSYSSGMQVRLGFSIASALETDILLLDEVLAVGDAAFQSKCLKRIGALLHNCAVIFVSHNAYQTRRICDSVLWLSSGKVCFYGATESGMQMYAKSHLQDVVQPRFINCADFISKLSCEAKVEKSTKDGMEIANIIVELSFYSDQDCAVGMPHGNIITIDEVVAGQFDLGNCIPCIQKGRNFFHFKIADLRLANGEYSCSIGIFDSQKKDMLINIRHFVRFSISGNKRYGSLYAIPTHSLRPV